MTVCRHTVRAPRKTERRSRGGKGPPVREKEELEESFVKKKEHREWIRALKFALFSASAGIIELGVFTLLNEWTGWPYWPSYLIALVLSVLWNFTLNRKFTFQSAANVPVAMAKVALYYAVFTPLSTWFGNYLAQDLGWNEYLVTALNMAINFVTEFLYQRWFVFGKSIDTAKARNASPLGCSVGEKKNPWTYRLIRWLVWLFSPKYRLEGTENLPDGPCVIVGNHSQMYGPIGAELYTPGPHYTWCAGEMMHRENVAEYAFRDFWSSKPKAVRWFYRILSHLITPLSVHIFTNACTIPVYHDTRVISTFRLSVARLAEGGRIVIFPENYDEHNNIVHAFQTRFVDVARLYFRKTGEELDFVPMYMAPRLKTICYGAPVRFRSDAPIESERVRICDHLMDTITEMAVALPEHTVVPYPNIPKNQYPKNVPLEEYAHETADV